MNRWLVRAAHVGLACLSIGGPIVGSPSCVVCTLGAQEPFSVRSPSDVQAAPASVRRNVPDDPWMRGLDDITGPDDLVGSAVRPETGPNGRPLHQVPLGELNDADLYTHPPNCACCVNRVPVSRFRQGFYQGSSVSAGFLSDRGDYRLSQAHYELTTRFAVPIDGMENVLIIAPSIREEIIDAPVGIDIPDSLYNAGVNFTWLKTLSSQWKLTAMLTPSVRSDFNTSEEAFRLFGLGMLTYSYIPDTLDASFGVVFLDRDDIPLLPVLGFTWRPNPFVRIDANFPRPRIAYQTAKCGGESESWVYTGVALGGNTWAVERADGSNDVLTLRDYQWVFGWEHIRSGGRGMFVEAGSSFGRSLEFESNTPGADFDSAAFIRGGLNF